MRITQPAWDSVKAHAISPNRALIHVVLTFKPADATHLADPQLMTGEPSVTPIRLAVMLVIIAGGVSVTQPATAAKSYDSCTNFIAALPATLSTQGNWCLRKDLVTANTSGNAITINANNVTIDCNDFKIGGLAAGNGSVARGIHANDRQNATIRNCNIRGFYYGVELVDGAGHLVEDNRLDNNLLFGISVSGVNSRVRRNAVYDTGGALNTNYVYGIYAKGDVVDNTVTGLFVDSPAGILFGIVLNERDAVASGNKVSGFDMTTRQGGNVDSVYGLFLRHSRQRASGNQIAAKGSVTGVGGVGIYSSFTNNYCLGNTVGAFAINIDDDCISHGNLTSP